MMPKDGSAPTISIPTAAELTSMRAQYGMSAAPTPATPTGAASNGAAGYLTPAATQQQQQQQQQQQAMLNMQMQQSLLNTLQMQSQQQQQRPATASAYLAAATPRTNPTTPVDPTIELRQRIRVLETQLADAQAQTNEWKKQWEQSRATIADQQRTITQLQQHRCVPPSPAPDVIPLASAASLKRRRTAANSNDSDGEPIVLDDAGGDSSKKARRKA
jgi:hypothetical protein